MRPHHVHSERSLYRLWWLEPSLLFALVVVGTMLAAFAQSDAAFQLYGTPKFIGDKHVLLAGGAVVVFAVGCWLATATGRVPRHTPAAANRVVRAWFWLCLGLALVGYGTWLAVGVKNGFSLGVLLELLTTDDPQVAHDLSDEMFLAVTGITTCTQFGIAAVLLGWWLFFLGEHWVLWPLGLLFSLATVRALVFSERLAVIELALPAFVVVLRGAVLGRPLSRLVRWGLQFAPVLGFAALLVFFGAFEYFRSWRYYHNDFDSYTEFTLWRIGGYYTTAHNNGAMALETQRPYPLPYATLRQFWSIPGLSKTALGYQSITNIDPHRRHLAMLEKYGTPELNNEGGLFQPVLDYGLGGYVIFWFGCGFVAGRLYRHYLVGTLAGLTLFPLIVIAILETPRLLYLCYTRSLPALVAILVLLWLVSSYTHRGPATDGTPSVS